MSKIALTPNASGTGTLTIAAPNTSTNRTLTLPDETGTLLSSTTNITSQAMNGPAFFASASGGGQSVATVTYTKVAVASEAFDTNSCYDNSTYRFTPNVAGYYRVDGRVYWVNSVTSSTANIYKNGASYITRYDQGTYANLMQECGAIIYMNGSTDYLELYGYHQQGTNVSIWTGMGTFFQAYLVRAA